MRIALMDVVTCRRLPNGKVSGDSGSDRCPGAITTDGIFGHACTLALGHIIGFLAETHKNEHLAHGLP